MYNSAGAHAADAAAGVQGRPVRAVRRRCNSAGGGGIMPTMLSAEAFISMLETGGAGVYYDHMS